MRLRASSRPSWCSLQQARRSLRSRPQASFQSARPSTSFPQVRPHARAFCKRIVTRIRRFPQRFLSRPCIKRVHLDVRDPIHNRSSGPQLQDRAFSLGSDGRFGFICGQLSFSPSLAVLRSAWFCGIEGALVLADNDPPDRSVSPATAIVDASNVTSQNLPQTTKPCHCDPFTSSERYL